MTSFTSSFGLPAGIQAQLRALGAELNPMVIEQTRALLGPTRDMNLPAGALRHSDLAYGTHERQKLDMCQPAGAGHPIVLFVPGGGFTGGDKAVSSHIPAFFARSGFVGAIMNYRLAPQFQWPSGAQDVAAALDWLATNAAQYGGDASRLFVVAQSAGAVHASGALFDPTLRPHCRSAVRGLALMSGLYNITAELRSVVQPYFGDDTTQYLDRSPVRFASESLSTVLMTTAEFDPPMFAPQAATLMSAVTASGVKSPQLTWLRGHNHFSPVIGLGGRHDLLGPAILEEFRRA